MWPPLNSSQWQSVSPLDKTGYWQIPYIYLYIGDLLHHRELEDTVCMQLSWKLFKTEKTNPPLQLFRALSLLSQTEWSYHETTFQEKVKTFQHTRIEWGNQQALRGSWALLDHQNCAKKLFSAWQLMTHIGSTWIWVVMNSASRAYVWEKEEKKE